jgi:hypothetical protein
MIVSQVHGKFGLDGSRHYWIPSAFSVFAPFHSLAPRVVRMSSLLR